jgi:hypothetical protein
MMADKVSAGASKPATQGRAKTGQGIAAKKGGDWMGLGLSRRRPFQSRQWFPSRKTDHSGGTESCRGLGCGSFAARRGYEKPLIRPLATFPPGGKDPMQFDSERKASPLSRETG